MITLEATDLDPRWFSRQRDVRVVEHDDDPRLDRGGEIAALVAAGLGPATGDPTNARAPARRIDGHDGGAPVAAADAAWPAGARGWRPAGDAPYDAGMTASHPPHADHDPADPCPA